MSVPHERGDGKKLQIAHVTYDLNVGGLERLLVDFARHADRERFRLRFISLGSRGRLAEEIDDCGWPVHALGKPSGLRPSLAWQLAQLFRQHAVDVVHTHDMRALFYGAPAAKLSGGRKVVHMQHRPLIEPSSRQVFAYRNLSRLTSHFVGVSEDCTEQALGFGISASRALTIPNGVDLNRFDYTGPKDDGAVVAVARLNPEKGFDVLIRAVAIAAAETPDLRVEIAGDGPCRSDLERLIAELNVGEYVCLLGDVRDVPTLLSTARLFVLPSRAEGTSLTLLEAMGRGLPIVATRVGGTPEVIEDGVTGLLVESDNTAEMAAAISQLWSDGARGRAMGLAGRSRAETHFDLGKMIAAYESLYL